MNNQAKTSLQILALCALWIIVSIAARFWIETPSFKPVMAVAILGGLMFRDKKLAMILPLLIMAATDLFFQTYHWQVMVSVYFCMAIPACFPLLIRSRQLSLKKFLLFGNGSAIVSAFVFFVVVNFAVWAFTPWYQGEGAAGLISCYAAAVPFLIWMLLGNLFFFNGLSIASAVVVKLVQRWETTLATEQVI